MLVWEASKDIHVLLLRKSKKNKEKKLKERKSEIVRKEESKKKKYCGVIMCWHQHQHKIFAYFKDVFYCISSH